MSFIEMAGLFRVSVGMSRLFVVLACTLAGGVERTLISPPHNASCGLGTRWGECSVLDNGITPEQILIPWAVLLATLVFLSMPTILLRSTDKEKGLSMVAWSFLQCLALMAFCLNVTDHPSLQFVLSLHSSARLLEQMDVSPPLGGFWWETRHLSVLGLLMWEVVLGPAVSIVRWPGAPEGLQCAYLAHLAGAIVPDSIMLALHLVRGFFRCVNLREE